MSTEKFSTILNTLEHYAESEKIALICGGETLTYKQLSDDAKNIAHRLVSEGIKKGDHVLLCMRTTANAIRALFGILYAGGVYVAADPDWPEERLRFAEKDGQTVYSITDETYINLCKKDPSSVKLPEIRGEDEAAIYYTSGTTGQPKGVILHHIVLGAVIPDASDYQINWKTAQLIFKLSFVALIMDICYVIARGNTFIVSTDDERNSVDLIADSMKRYNADTIAGSASLFLRFVENTAFANVFSKLRFISLGAEKVEQPVISKLSALTKSDIWFHYASSEMFLCAEYLYKNDGKIYLGKAVHGVEIYLLNENKEKILHGQKGELFIGGIPAKYGCYLNRPDLDAEKYFEDSRYGRLFSTGDYARLEEDGEISIIGRIDSMIKLHGQRIEIAEIEKVIGSYEGISRAAVRLIGKSPHEMLAGYYTASEDVQEGDLRRYLADKLPYYMVPSLFMKIDVMPETSHGKLNYRGLPDIAVPEQQYIPPETEIEKLLCKIFGEILHTENTVGINDNFFALGGDSINGMVAVSRLQKLGYYFEVKWLFTAPTVKELSKLLIPVSDENLSDNAAILQLSKSQLDEIDKNIGLENTECVYPVTSLVNEKINDKAPYLVYGMWEINSNIVTPDELKKRLEEMTEKHQALRSVFLKIGEKNFQTVLRKHKPNIFCVNLSFLSDGEELSQKQKDYFRNLIKTDANNKTDLLREVPFSVGLIQISETKSILFLSFSHLLLDGTGAERVIQELIGNADIHDDKAVWQQRISRFYNYDYTNSLLYWQKLLNGCKDFTSIPVKNGDSLKKTLSPESFYVSGGKKIYAKIRDYTKKHKITFAALIHYAFGKTLMELLGTDDVCFASEGNGRTVADAEIPGMFILHFPFRLRRGESLTDCQVQLINSASDFHLFAVSEPDFIKGFNKCHAVLNVQNIFDYHGKAKQILNAATLSGTFEEVRALEKQVLMTHKENFKWFMRVITDENYSLSCSVVYNANRYEPDFMKKIPQEFLRQLHLIIDKEEVNN